MQKYRQSKKEALVNYLKNNQLCAKVVKRYAKNINIKIQ